MIHLSTSASNEIKRLLSKQKNSNILFRLGVDRGGCADMYYTMAPETNIKPNDIVYDCKDIRIVVADQSWDYIKDITIDYSEDLMGGGFRFQNPNASQTCGCGNSFFVPDRPGNGQ